MVPDPWTTITHSLALHKLTNAREKSTSANQFRRLVRQMGLLLCSEMTRDLELKSSHVTTHNSGVTTGSHLDQSRLVILPILRSGLPLQESFLELLPSASVGHVGIYRDAHKRHQCYMLSLPAVHDATYFVLDPVISRGLTQAMAIDYLLGRGVPARSIRVGCLISSRIGLEQIYSDESRKGIKLYTFCDSDSLDPASFFLMPGIGNVGARLFGTED